jgi:FkbM family methyltransferase
MKHCNQPFISYAQNREDVLLWRVFRDYEKGFYVDVGAAHPEWESVTKAFYDRGWIGINFEPNPHFHSMLEKERPRDVNIRALAGSQSGQRELHIVGQSGLSTASAEIQNLLKSHGKSVTEKVVCQVVRLDDVFREKGVSDVHFLKIDAEGMEREVLEGCAFTEVRPKVLVIESTLPETNIRREDGIREYLDARRYNFVFFDGLNDYYVASECCEFAGVLALPANVLDNYRSATEVYLENRLERAAEHVPAPATPRNSAQLFKRISALFGSGERALKAKDVEWAYRLFLRRPPESEAIVEAYLTHCKGLKELVESVTGSREYEYKKYNIPISVENREDLHYFFHIHKTGGMSVHEYLFDSLPKGFLFPAYHKEDFFKFGAIRDFSFFSGHFGALPLAIETRNLRIAMVLRDPMRRGWSHYKHVHRDPALDLHDDVCRNSATDFIFGRSAPFIFGNLQARHLAELSPLSRRFSEGWAAAPITDDELYDMAIDGLSKVELVGVTEQLGEFLASLSRAWSLPPPAVNYICNTDPQEIPMDLPEQATEKIRELCAVDLKIYEEVAKSFQSITPDR